jgi:hypothetical protein
MPKTAIVVGGIEFATKAALQREVQRILNDPSWKITPPDHDFMIAFFARHPSAKEKRGPGIAQITIERNPKYGTRGFWIRRVDGTTTDISYKECLTPSGPDDWFRQAARNAVRPQRDAARAASTATHCPITGVPLDDTAQVDHEPPWTFEAIVLAFLDETKVDVAGDLYRDGDNVIDTQFKNANLESQFAAYHAARAKLRLVSKRANLSDLQKGKR